MAGAMNLNANSVQLSLIRDVQYSFSGYTLCRMLDSVA
jgi:hypothetical protein